MNNYKIVIDTNSDIPQHMIDELCVHAIPMRFVLDGVEYENYADGRKYPFDEFYKKLRSGSISTTNQISFTQFFDEIKPILDEGLDVLYLSFSSGLSGSYNTCCLAAKELLEEYPERKIIVVDTLAASMGEGLIAYYAVQEKNKGKTMEEVAKWVEDNRLKVTHNVVVDDLNHLKRGGRLSGSSAFFGTMLNIKPLLHITNEGKLVPIEKIRGRRQSLDTLVSMAKNDIKNPSESIVFLSHADCEEEAQYIVDKIKSEVGVKEVVMNFIGPVVGGHAGPGTIAIFYMSNGRE